MEIGFIGPGRLIQAEIDSYDNSIIITQPTDGKGNMYIEC